MKDLFRIISHRFQKNKKQSVSVLAIIITFVMVYSLIMPAVAIERDAAEKEPGMTIEETASESVAAEAMAEAEPASLEAEEAVTEDAAVEESAADEAAVEEPAAEEIQTESAAPAAAPADNSAADNSYVAADSSAAQQGASVGAAPADTGAAQNDENKANADSKADPSDSDTKSSDAEEEMPAQNFEQVIKYKEIVDEDGNTVDKQIKVVVDAAKDTFPAGTTMKAELILDNADVEKAVEDAVKKAAGELADATSIVQYRAVDITFADKDGQKVEPARKVEVRITSDKIAEIVNPMLVHVNVNDQNGRVINADVFPKKDVSIIDEKPDTIDGNENTMLFKASRFSPYVIIESQTIDEEGDAMHGLNGVEENADKGAEAADGKSGSVADGVLIAESDNYTVTIQFDENANIPDDAEIEINEIPEASRQYQSYMSEAEKLLIGDENKNGENASGSKTINYAKIVDVNIVSATEGTVIPDADVDVDIAYKETEEIAEGTVMQALSFNGRTPAIEKDALVYGGETYVDGMQVTTDKLPAYAIVGTETITTEYISHEGTKYEVTVTYGPEAKIPEGSWLRVEDIDAGTDAYDYARNAVLADKKEKGEFVDIDDFNLAALDISIIDPNGNEIEPEDTVQVDIKIKSLPEVENLNEIKDSLEVQHHVEVADGVVIDKVFDGAVEGAYEMATDEEIVKTGIVIDPSSISEEDFKVSNKAVVEDGDDNNEVSVSFDTDVFSTFTITWGGASRGTSNSTATLRFRRDNTNYATVTVHFVDENGTAITRPGNANIDQTAPTNNNTSNYTLGTGIYGTITNWTYVGTYTDSARTQPITQIRVARGNQVSGYNNRSIAYYNNNTQVGSTVAAYNTPAVGGDIYVVYRDTSTHINTTVHYGYMNGSTFVEFTAQPSPATVTTSDHAYLIYDFDGYKYADHTYYRTSATTGNPATNGTEIQARLRYNNNNWQYRSNNWNNIADNSHIYVIYEAETAPTQGGTATTKPVQEGEEPEEPTITKDSIVNGDGTNTLSLSVTGRTMDLEVEKLADVIVVFDVSGSMSRDISSESNVGVTDPDSRMYQLKNAVNSLADTLLSEEYENSEGEKLIRMSLVTFSTSASSASEFTNDPDVFKGWVDDLGANGGTNWEQALYEANTASVDTERATFVIFVTDGEPTFRVSRMDVTDADLDINSKNNNDTYYLSDNVFGNGSSDPSDYNYDAALAEAQSIVSHNKNLYTIGVGPEVGNLTDFGTAAGASGNYTATSSSDLTDAFDEIIAEISALMGWGDIAITDGITGLTQTVEKSGLLNVDGNFEYWKAPAPSNWSTMTEEEKAAYVPADSAFESWDPSSENCEEAEYDEASGAVLWNMGDEFVPADGVTYKVTFKVWPKQEAYDILAALQNGTISYSELDQDIQAQIDEDTLTLKTNEDDAGYSYKSATKTGDTVTVSGDPRTGTFPAVDPLIMATDEVTVAKTWENAIDSTQPHDITLQVWGDGTLYKSFELTQENNWTASDGYISCGLMTVNESTGHVEVYENGHDFILKEVGEGSYYWDLKADTYHPMVINNERVTLILVDPADVPSAMSGDYYNSGTDKYYRINGSVYKYVSSASEGITLTAENHHRTYVDLSKMVVAGEENTPIEDTTEFTYNITLNDALGEENGNQGYLFFTVRDVAGRVNLDDTVVTTSATFYPVGGVPYFRVFTGEEFTLKIRQGWNVRFLNLAANSTYSIEEQDQTDYEFVSISATEMSGDASIPVEAEIDGALITGKVTSSNVGHTIQYMNRVEARQVTLLKTTQSGKGNPLSGAEFDLYTKAGYESNPKAAPIKTGIVSSSEEGKEGQLDLGILPIGDYYLVETKAPSGYNLLTEAVSLKVNSDRISVIQGTSERQDITPDDVDFDAFITNDSGVVLPMTGGPGTLPHTLGGIVLIMASALMYGFRMRRRERRLN